MDLDELADRLDSAADRTGEVVEQHMRRVGRLGVARIKENASGRPGPMVRNTEVPNYRDSWKSETSGIPYGAECVIGTNKPQGKRLEFGFYDMTDSLGRHYFQPPFPHVQPALPFIEDTLHEQMRAAVEELLGD
jgi:hypothetical protein